MDYQLEILVENIDSLFYYLEILIEKIDLKLKSIQIFVTHLMVVL
jgi:hypothetical protein